MEKIQGLSEEEVKKLTERGLVNKNTDVKTKSISQIIATNFFTLFNFLNLGLGLAIFLVHSYKNLLFLGVALCNTLISTVQEIRSKLIIDKLSLLNETKARVIRGGEEKEIGIHEIVLGDIISLRPGNQIVTDSKVLSGEMLINESLITGESEPVTKKRGDNLLSGSFVVSGRGICETVHVGDENYTAKISAEAKYIKKVNSELMNFINKILKYVSLAIVPIGILFFIGQLGENDTFAEAVVATVAGLIGMIPEGLVLLISTVLAISVIRLSKYKVLVQELYCIETLARVDTICLDKTGTLTTGEMDVSKIVPIGKMEMDEIIKVLSSVSFHMDNDNQTMDALAKKYAKEDDRKVIEVVPFSSQAKWSGISFVDESFIIGAPEIVIQDTSHFKDVLDEYTSSNRVVILARSWKKLNKEIPNDIEPLALIVINDRIRPEARGTLEYFKAQGVDIKLISGDNPKTVAGVAAKVGVENIKYIDLSKTKRNILDLVDEYNIFGRVKPDQKKEIIMALKAKGKTVAMTGDGVNDVLALKEADCSVAMNSGSDAARNVSQLVLLDSNFASMPKVVAEGRRSINNLQRSSSLFLCKTTYATLLAIIFVFLNRAYPFIPIQLTLTSVVTIGIPSFILALEPNRERINGKLILNVLRRSLPTGLTIVSNILIIMMLPWFLRLTEDQMSTLCVLLTAFTGFMLIYRICVPFNNLRRTLFVVLIILFVVGITIFRRLFSIVILTPDLLIIAGILFVIAFLLFNFFTKLFELIVSKLKI